MKYRITITHGSYNPSPFDFDAVSARDAVREVAADGDWEPNVDGPAWALPPSGGWVVTRGPEGDLVSPQPSGLRLPWYLRDRERAACLLPADGLWNAPTPCGATICGVAKDTREMHERLHFENCLHGCKAAP